MKLEFSRQSFEKYSNTEFNDSPSNGCRVVPCRQTDRDLLKLTVLCRNFADFPKIFNKYFENVAHFTFSDMKRANQNCSIGEIECKLDSGNACA